MTRTTTVQTFDGVVPGEGLDGGGPGHAGGRVLDFDGADFGVSDRGHVGYWDAFIDDDVVVDGGVVDDGGLVVNLGDLRGRQLVNGHFVGGKVVDGDEGEAAGRQAKVEANAHAHAVEAPAGVDREGGARRQRRPAAVVACHSPTDPCGRPGC